MKVLESGDGVCITGTRYLGTVKADYEQLVRVFGEPLKGSDKTTCEWNVEIYDEEFDSEHVVALYDWKETDWTTCRSTPNYEWNIGGKDVMDMYALLDVLEAEGVVK